ncbi:MAG: chromosome segregation protein SMC [Peptococcaceae bacterium]|nr:chromosome segregation protein SMC [Peptococcaceae bacterium]
MYLKKLEIHGFKSFADKTVLEFRPGITLVVGPNGSGKSNIADAIRWVLGEQSVKSLRGGKMEDVIFAGSEKRRSLGMAEVSLTIDNTAGDFPMSYSEVTVTRRLYRSGESDYLINRTPCRLKDIHELFMDTGVGREGFSMIGQGKVDEILQARPEERRGIIEDAAGIVKYRYRKREALRKLEETDAHLLRLEDLLLELEGQEGPLKNQAEEAGRYKALKEELDMLEVGLIVDEAEDSRKKLEDAQAQFQKISDELLSEKSGFLVVQGQEESLRLELSQNAEALNQTQEEIYQKNLRLEAMETEYRYGLERGESIQQQIQDLEADNIRLDAEWKDMTGDWNARQEEGAVLAERLGQTRESLEQMEKEQAREQEADFKLRSDLEQMKEDHFGLIQEDSTLGNEEQAANRELQSMEKQAQVIETHARQLEESRLALQKEKENLDADIQMLETTRKTLENGLSFLEQKQETARAELEKIQQANRLLSDERSQALSRFKILDEMEREGQGYAQGVREILRHKTPSRFAGIVGTVAQAIRIPKEYELAVEVALGGGAQNLIAESERAAQEAIRWLKAQNKGRVTFLPMDTVKAPVLQKDGLPRGKGIIGRMSDLVDFEDRFLGVFEFLLGRIWLTEDLALAVARARETHFRWRMVSLDGQVVNAGGSLTGGSMKVNATGILGRRRQLEELDRVIRSQSDALLEGEAREERAQGQVDEVADMLSQARDEIQEVKLRQVRIQGLNQQKTETLNRLIRDQEGLALQRDETSGVQGEVLGRMAVLRENRALLADQIRRMDAEIQQVKSLVQANEAQRPIKQERLMELRVAAATIEEKLNAFDRENADLRRRMEQIRNKKLGQEENAALLRKRKSGILENAQSMAKEKTELAQALAEMEDRKAALQTRKAALQDQAVALDEDQKKKYRRIQQREDQVHQLELQKSRYSVSLEEVSKRIAVFGVSLEEAVEKAAPIRDRRAARERIDWLRQETEGMDQVNLGAMEEYQRLLERLDFMRAQISDLTEAKKELRNVIREMDELVARRFKETFEQVNESFSRMFVTLFEGGRGRLSLTQPDNLLETGVEIMAQPPGKKHELLTLLSGGEKALTAIALLLAMLQIRPSPFCVLDEIESSLDEANVVRFGKVVKMFADRCQFIAITHRKGTMEIGDVLYGVTVEESTGVSKLISVRMEDARAAVAG